LPDELIGSVEGLFVAAGPNGGGKSTVIGGRFAHLGAAYYNPDVEARRLIADNPGLPQHKANIAAWEKGVMLLDDAIEKGRRFAFETTLGGSTITARLMDAARRGVPVRMWYVALASVDLHLDRVRQRVELDGHDIPETDVRRRYIDSPKNLIRLLPHLTDLHVFDNSQVPEPDQTEFAPRLLLRLREREIEFAEDDDRPDWARPVLAAARTRRQ
jgi:predicted ABC-type ATPase